MGGKGLQGSLSCSEVARHMHWLDTDMGSTRVKVFIQSALYDINASRHHHGIDKSITAAVVEVVLTETQTEPAATVIG